MGKILDAFASEKFMAKPVIEKRSPKRQELIEKVHTLHETLSKKLDDENKELLEELLNTVYDENCCYAEESFIYGYRLGVLMTMEIVTEQDMLLNGNE